MCTRTDRRRDGTHIYADTHDNYFQTNPIVKTHVWDRPGRSQGAVSRDVVARKKPLQCLYASSLVIIAVVSSAASSRPPPCAATDVNSARSSCALPTAHERLGGGDGGPGARARARTHGLWQQPRVCRVHRLGLGRRRPTRPGEPGAGSLIGRGWRRSGRRARRQRRRQQR